MLALNYPCKTMSASVNNCNQSLLALLLALQDLETPLSDREQSGLAEVAAQLCLDPDAWESDIEPNLLATIQDNVSLSRLYQSVKSRLDAIGGNIPLNLLPAEVELEQTSPCPESMLARGFHPEGDPSDYNSHEITNVAVNVLSAPNSTKMVQDLSRLEKLKEFLMKPIG